MKTSTLLAAFLLAACTTVVSAEAAPTGSTAYYYDDGARRPLTLEPGLIAEVGPGRATAVKAALPAAEVVHASGGATVYKAAAADVAVALSTPKARLSPVYREGAGGLGQLKALPGGVLVSFKPDWSPEQVLAFVTQRGLGLSQKLGLPGNWYLVTTAAGDASLRAANALQESGAVLSAAPNWWTQVVPR